MKYFWQRSRVVGLLKTSFFRLDKHLLTFLLYSLRLLSKLYSIMDRKKIQKIATVSLQYFFNFEMVGRRKSLMLSHFLCWFTDVYCFVFFLFTYCHSVFSKMIGLYFELYYPAFFASAFFIPFVKVYGCVKHIQQQR